MSTLIVVYSCFTQYIYIYIYIYILCIYIMYIYYLYKYIYIYIIYIYITLRIWIPCKPKKHTFSVTSSGVHCFLLNNYLSRWNFLEIFYRKYKFRPMKIAPHSFATEMRFSKFSVAFVFSNWLYSLKRKPENAGNF